MAKLNTVGQSVSGSPALRQTLSLDALLKSDTVASRFKEVLGKKSPGFISSILAATNINPKLKLCEPMTVVSSAMVAATLDLPINPSLGFAHIVPYSNRAQFQIGWRGLVQLAIRTGQYKTMNASEVYEGELKSFNRLTGEIEIDISGKKSDRIVGYLAFFRMVNGFEKYLYMTVEQVHAHGKRYSKSFNSDEGRWKLDFDAMAKKTVLKMLLSKYALLSVELQKAIVTDQAVIADIDAAAQPDVAIDVSEETYPDAKAQEVVKADPVTVKPTETILSPEDDAFDAARKELGDEDFFKLLGSFGYEKAEEVPAKDRRSVLNTMNAQVNLKKGKK